MRHWLALGFVPQLDQLIPLAREAERLGFYGVTVADHLVMPADIETPYPYSPDGKPFWPADMPWPDPWVALMAMGAVTERLALASNIYLAALRDPFTAAKAVATASALTGGRVRCGVAAGWLKEEFDLMGVDFKTRGSRLNELIGVLRSLWTGERVEHQGAHYQFPPVVVRPAPDTPIPIWCGGGSKWALRRAARHGDGWLGLIYRPDDLWPVLDDLAAHRADAGRAEEPFDILVGLAARATPELVAEAADRGVTGLVTTPWMFAREDTSALETKLRYMHKYAEHTLETT